MKQKLSIFVILILITIVEYPISPIKLINAEETNSTNTSSEQNNIEAVGPSLSIDITSPENGNSVNKNNVNVTGNVTTNTFTSSDQFSIDVYQINSDFTEQLLASTTTNGQSALISVLPPVEGEDIWSWSFSKEFAEGEYQIIAKVYGTADPEIAVKSENHSFTVAIRPMLKSVKVQIGNYFSEENQLVDLQLYENLTQVIPETSIEVVYSDETAISADKISNGFVLISKDGSSVAVEKALIQQIDSKNVKITYKPKTPLSPSHSYFIMINPDSLASSDSTTDSLGTKLFPAIKKFTTLRGNYEVSYDPNTGLLETNDPHGNYMTNANACINCHGTHTASGKNLLVSANGDAQKNSGEAYCMACHDGTVAAPFPEHADKTYSHDDQLEPTTSSGACTSCHNPHLTWTQENPNLLRDHYTYTHIDTVNAPGNTGTPGEYDSLNGMCETCHDKETTVIMGNSEVEYKVMHYRKFTADGTSESYLLCFRCHDGTKEWTDSNNIKTPISNIKQYYEQTNSSHRITAMDGGMLVKTESLSNGAQPDGHIPCAECHETHGSNNIKGLKEKLGHENAQSFSAESGTWDAAKERSFCLKCHNGTTAIYGVTGSKLNETTSGHGSGDSAACSSCHGTGATPEEKARSAAHAPKKGTPPTP